MHISYCSNVHNCAIMVSPNHKMETKMPNFTIQITSEMHRQGIQALSEEDFYKCSATSQNEAFAQCILSILNAQTSPSKISLITEDDNYEMLITE